MAEAEIVGIVISISERVLIRLAYQRLNIILQSSFLLLNYLETSGALCTSYSCIVQLLQILVRLFVIR